jgi:hypothetical protein
MNCYQFFQNGEVGSLRSGASFHANAASPYILELISRWWYKKGANSIQIGMIDTPQNSGDSNDDVVDFELHQASSIGAIIQS